MTKSDIAAYAKNTMQCRQKQQNERKNGRAGRIMKDAVAAWKGGMRNFGNERKTD
jgi:hypothetical protein